MAKGAANETQLGFLHAKITAVFQRVLDRYEARLDKLDTMDADTLEEDLLAELFSEEALPSPAMLSAVSKFLKDNSINFDNEQVATLSDTERRLADRKAQRGKLVDLTNLRVNECG